MSFQIKSRPVFTYVEIGLKLFELILPILYSRLVLLVFISFFPFFMHMIRRAILTSSSLILALGMRLMGVRVRLFDGAVR